ncbi:alpha/beta hydrolase [Sandarakinorhabdus rubra]|uniref:alpha/beta hydrolase n=1 Tax=Sandarakinorhabdus rubra TaxID=2672568 RepID=UPI001F1FDA8C|nr:alpha/beta hydrolase [Sandarakinorhabdus rubra]
MSGAGPGRARGPHPLPLFLATVQGVCGDDRARLARVLAGLARYQSAPPSPPRTPWPEIARVGGVTLRAMPGRSRASGGAPLVLVPSLINPPDVLDLAPGQSLAAHLAAAGWRPLLVDWGAAPEPLGLTALVRDRLVPLLAALGRPVPLVGYCLGGTLALAAARDGAGTWASRVALLAAPWRFGAYGEGRAALGQWWRQAQGIATPLGVVPMDLLQPAFWALDPAALAAKYEKLTSTDDAALTGFARLEDWANGGAPLSLAAAADLAALFETGATGIGGDAVPRLPILDVVAMRDRIVPPAAALTAPGDAGRLEVDGGHVGMVVGGRAREMLWEPLAQWLGAAD